MDQAEKAKVVMSPVNAHRRTKTEAVTRTNPTDVIVEGETTKDGEGQSLDA